MQLQDIVPVLNVIIKPYEDKIRSLQEEIELLKEQNKKPAYRSTEIKDLATALCKAQAEYKVAALNSINPYFHSEFADLEEVVSASRPALCKYGISVSQETVSYDDGTNMLHTKVMHESGQFLESRIRSTPPQNDIRTIASYNAFLKRDAYGSMLGVVMRKEDDDGEIAMETTRKEFAKGFDNKYNPREASPEVISKEQREDIEYELAEYPDIAEDMLKNLKVQSISLIPKSKHRWTIETIRRIKKTRNGE